MATTAKKKTVLIVEDEHAMARILDAKLSSAGYTVKRATNGSAGLAAIKKHRPDLILLDIVMPKMDGFTMLRRLRASKGGREIPVIILTNLTDGPADGEPMQADQIADYLIKTEWTLEEILEKIRAQIGNGRTKQRLA